MRLPRHRILVVALAAATFVLMGGTAIAAPTTLGWDTVSDIAAAAYDRGPGTVGWWRAEGFRRAGDAVPGIVRGLDVGVEAEVPVSGASESFGETGFTALVAFELGSRKASEQGALAARVLAEEAQRAADKLLFVERVQDAYLRWWIADRLASRFEEHQAEAMAELAPLQEAARSRVVSRLDVYDLEVEVARLASEAALAHRRVTEAESELRLLVGDDMALPSAGTGAAACPAPAAGNPWQPLQDRVEHHPALRALAAEAAAARAEADAADAATPVELGAGLRGRRERDGVVSVGALLELSIPFGNAAAPEREQRRAEASAAEAERAWRFAQLRAGLVAEGRRYDAAAQYHADLAERLLRTLSERQDFLARALAAGQVAMERVLRARRELHEAEHERAATAVLLRAHHARAAALERWLARIEPSPVSTMEPTPGGAR